MPKKRNQTPYTKPQSSPHPSISRSRNTLNDNDASHKQDAYKSVNDLLQHLRISQAPPLLSTEPRSDVNPKILHPLVASILQTPLTPPPRPRPGMRPFATPGRRRPPGPAAPRSWLESSIHTPPHLRKASSPHKLLSSHHPDLESFDPLPETILPNHRSLQHLAFFHLGKNWDFHVQYDQYYLATLLVRAKQILLTYIAKHSPNGISLDGLKTLFLSEHQLASATGAEGLTHLDLASSIGRSLSLKDLTTFITTTFTSIPDSWDEEEDDAPAASCLVSSPSIMVTTTITHLSLSHPPPNISWRSLLSLFPHLSTLTHLSLAFWPPPSLHPNSATACLSTPTGSVCYSPTTFYSHTLDQDFSGAASVLRQLSRQTYCLQYLDLTGCTDWLPALAWREGGIEWQGAWSGMRTLKVGRGSIPEGVENEGYGPIDSLTIQHTAAMGKELDDLKDWTRRIPRPHRLLRLSPLP
ncbi:MAG: hypothetical protein Q9210_007294 [Variospora velana]